MPPRLYLPQPLKQRAKSIEAFQKDPPTTVFLLSVRSGAVGINLTAGSRACVSVCGRREAGLPCCGVIVG